MKKLKTKILVFTLCFSIGICPITNVSAANGSVTNGQITAESTQNELEALKVKEKKANIRLVNSQMALNYVGAALKASFIPTAIAITYGIVFAMVVAVRSQDSSGSEKNEYRY